MNLIPAKEDIEVLLEAASILGGRRPADQRGQSRQ